MSRETEFVARHKEDLKRAVELCNLLAKNAVEKAPRELNYLELRAICKRLEGSLRQMAHERGDDFRWLEGANLYFKCWGKVQELRRRHKWLMFLEMAKVFEAGHAKLDRLANSANGVTSLNPSGLLILPRYLQKQSQSGLILP